MAPPLWLPHLTPRVGGGRWKLFFDQLCRMELAPYKGRPYPVDVVFNFLRSYIMPYGVLHGADTQGGLQEGNMDPFVQVSYGYLFGSLFGPLCGTSDTPL